MISSSNPSDARGLDAMLIVYSLLEPQHRNCHISHNYPQERAFLHSREDKGERDMSTLLAICFDKPRSSMSTTELPSLGSC